MLSPTNHVSTVIEKVTCLYKLLHTDKRVSCNHCLFKWGHKQFAVISLSAVDFEVPLAKFSPGFTSSLFAVLSLQYEKCHRNMHLKFLVCLYLQHSIDTAVHSVMMK